MPTNITRNDLQKVLERAGVKESLIKIALMDLRSPSIAPVHAALANRVLELEAERDRLRKWLALQRIHGELKVYPQEWNEQWLDKEVRRFGEAKDNIARRIINKMIDEWPTTTALRSNTEQPK